MPPVRLRAVSRTQGNNAALKSGDIDTPGLELSFEEVPVLVHAFRRMVRELAYDVCEMALTTYVCARAHGVRFTALPIFLVRGLHHDKVQCNTGAGIHEPKDIEGRRVGVHRGYTVTTGVWARGILADEYGVDLHAVIWALSGDEHVASYEPPANVVPLADNEDLPQMLIEGELPAAVNAKVEHPDVAPLVEDPDGAAMRALEERGLYPINHLVVVRDEVLEENPEVATLVFDAFATSKRRYIDALHDGRLDEPTGTDRMYRRIMDALGDDPLPYGLEPNRPMLETLLRYAVDQRIIGEPVSIESLFHPATHDLSA